MIPGTKVTLPVTACSPSSATPTTRRSGQEWQDFLTKRGRLDMVVVRADDKLNGLEGTFGAGTGDAIEFTANGERPEADRPPRPGAGIDLRPEARPGRPAAAVQGDRHRRQPARRRRRRPERRRADGDDRQPAPASRCRTPSGWRSSISARASWPTCPTWSRPAKSMTLATEDDDQYARFVRYRKDKNLDNQPISWPASSTPKGMTLHAGTQLVYRPRRRLQGVPGRRSASTRRWRPRAGSRSLIEGDGRELFRGQTSRARTRRRRSPWTSTACATCGSRSGRPACSTSAARRPWPTPR